MIIYFGDLNSGRCKRNERHYDEQTATVLEILLGSSKVEVISSEEQKQIFGRGYSYQNNKCSVYDYSKE